MTNLTDKLKKGIVAGAIGAASIFGIGSTDAYAQTGKDAADLTESEKRVFQMIKDKDLVNLKGVPAYVIPGEETEESSDGIESTKFHPFKTSIEGEDHFSRLSYGTEQVETKDGEQADVLKYHISDAQKQDFRDLFNKKEGMATIYKFNDGEADQYFNTIKAKDKEGNENVFIYFAIDEKKDSLMKQGKRLGVIFPEEGSMVFRDNMNEEYLVGNPNNLWYIELDEDERIDETLFKEAKSKLDSLGRPFLIYENLEYEFLGSNKINGDAYEFVNLPFLEKGEPEKEKAEFNRFRLDLGAGVTMPQGYELFLSPQINLSPNFSMGPYGTLSNSKRTLAEKITQDPAIDTTISVPAQIVYHNDGSKVTENGSVTANYGVGAIFSYNTPKVEANVRAGIEQQTTDKSTRHEGTEYLIIGGVKDPASEQSYDVTVPTSEKENVAKVGVGIKYHPWGDKDSALKGLAIFGDANKTFGQNGSFSGTAGIKYTLGK